MAITESERAIALAPNLATTHFLMAETLSLSGKPAEAIEIAHKGMRLDPINQDWYLMQVGAAYLNMDRAEDAIPVLQKFVIAYPGHVGGRFLLVAAYVLAGKNQQTQAQASELIRQSPQFSLGQYTDKVPGPLLSKLRDWTEVTLWPRTCSKDW